MSRILTVTSKLFTLLAVVCSVLGMLSVGSVKADPTTTPNMFCDCGAPPTTAGADWDAFVLCYAACESCSIQCGSAIPPGSPGREAWLECFNTNCGILLPEFIPACAVACTQPVPCAIITPNNPPDPPTFLCNGKRCTGPRGCFTFCRCNKVPLIDACSCQ